MSEIDAARRIIDAVLRKVKEDSYRLVYAVDILKPEPVKEKTEYMIATDGEHLFYDPDKVMENYRYNGTRVIKEEIFHVIMHGILGHFGKTDEFSRAKLAGYVMDLQIEQIMTELGMDSTYRCCSKPDWYKTVGFSLYNAALRDKDMAEKIRKTGVMRRVDDHSIWWKKEKSPESLRLMWEKAAKYLAGTRDLQDMDPDMVAGRLKESSGKYKDQGLFKPKGERQSFRETLSRFLKARTVSRDQPDYIDTALYDYGLCLYGDVPLVEPLEELEIPGMENLVIALDTSGSCYEHIGRFLNQLIGIFEETADHISFEKIYVIQCDEQIQKVSEYSRIDELDPGEERYECQGFGGTDFRPVFRWIDRNLINHGEQVDLLLYFSDAWGSFPKDECGYPVMFVLPESGSADKRQIPEWIDTVVMNEDQKTKKEAAYVQY